MTPCGKVRYPSERVAAAQASRSSRAHDEPMQPYRCLPCQAWHFGKRNRTSKPKLTAAKRRGIHELYRRGDDE